MVGTDGVLIVNWADTPAAKRAAETIERIADFITTVTRAGRDKQGKKGVLPSWGKENSNEPWPGFYMA